MLTIVIVPILVSIFQTFSASFKQLDVKVILVAVDNY